MALIGLVLLVFGRTCFSEFLSWDDTQYLATNQALLSPTLANLAAIWKSPEAGLYIPVPYTLWWLIAQAALVSDGAGRAALNPWLFHLANVAVHAAATALCFKLLRSFRVLAVAAFFGAAVWAVHPLAAESVAWSMGLRDLLGGALSIAALLLSTRGRSKSAAGILLLAVLSKPSSITILAIAIAIDWLYFRRPLRASVIRHWPMATVSAAGAALTVFYSPLIFDQISAPWQRPMIALDAIAFYVDKLLLPIGLTFDYARSPTYLFAAGQAYWTPLISLAVVVALAVLRSRTAALIAVIFAVPLLPVCGLVPFPFQTISTVADHYVYLSLLAPALAVALVADRRPTRAVRCAIGGVLLVFAGLSFAQAGVWADDRALYSHGIAINPRSAPAWNGLAGVELREGNAAAARSSAERAVAANPDYAFAHVTLMQLAMARGDTTAVDRELDELERTYRLQANFDPKLAAAVRAAIRNRRSGRPSQ